MKVRYYGVRGSIPTPLSPAELESKLRGLLIQLVRESRRRKGVSMSALMRGLSRDVRSTYGGNTPCIHISEGSNHLILDAGSGVRSLGYDLMQEEFGSGQGTAHFLFSHTHWDHIQGLPFFVPLFIQGNRFHFLSPLPDLEARLRVQHDFRFFPIDLEYMAAEKVFRLLPSEARVGPFSVWFMRQNHPGSSYSYRIESGGRSFVYSTDVEYNDRNFDQLQGAIEFCRDADVLTFDSQYTLDEALSKEDWGHSSIQLGIDVAYHANVGRVVLFHYDPAYSDERISTIAQIGKSYLEKQYAGSDIKVTASYEGLTLEL